MRPEVEQACSSVLQGTSTKWGTTRWSNLRHCEQRYVLQYRRKILPVLQPDDDKINSRLVGTLVHAVCHYMAGNEFAHLDQAGPRRWRDVFDYREALLQETGRDSTASDFEAERLLASYALFWGKRAWTFDNAKAPVRSVVECERLLRMGGGLRATCRADAVVELRDGRMGIVDHKTRGSKAPKNAAITWATRPQFCQLSYSLRQELGLDYFPPLIVNVLVKTKIPQFDRIPVEFSDRGMAFWLRNHIAWEAREQQLVNGELDPICNTDACAPDPGAGFACDWFEWCHGTDEDRVRVFGRTESEERNG